jgi:hypothetical protein
MIPSIQRPAAVLAYRGTSVYSQHIPIASAIIIIIIIIIIILPLPLSPAPPPPPPPAPTGSIHLILFILYKFWKAVQELNEKHCKEKDVRRA